MDADTPSQLLGMLIIVPDCELASDATNFSKSLNRLVSQADFLGFPLPEGNDALALATISQRASERASEHGKALLLLLCCKSTFLPTGLRLSPSDPRPVGHPCSRARVDGCIQHADRDNPVLATSSLVFCRLYIAKKRN
jgi:hypothetical protein